MRLATKISFIIALVALGGFLAAQWLTQRTLRDFLGTGFEQDREAAVKQANALLFTKLDVIRSKARILVLSPILRSLIEAPDIDQGSILDAMGESLTELDLDEFVVADPAGTVKAHKGQPGLAGTSWADRPWMGELRAGRSVAGLWLEGDRPSLVTLAPITREDSLMGIVLTGRSMKKVFEELGKSAGDTMLVLATGEQILDSTLPGAQAEALGLARLPGWIRQGVDTWDSRVLSSFIELGGRNHHVSRASRPPLGVLNPLGAQVDWLMLRDHSEADRIVSRVTWQMTLFCLAAATLFFIFFDRVLRHLVTFPLSSIVESISEIEQGRRSKLDMADRADEVGDLARSFDQHLATIRAQEGGLRDEQRVKSHVLQVTQLLQKERDMNAAASRAVTEICKLLDAGFGAFYLNEGLFRGKLSDSLVLAGRYAHDASPDVTPRIRMGEGLTGQAAKDAALRFVTGSVPLRIVGSLVEVPVAEAALVPITYESETLGVLEIALPRKADAGQKSLLEQMRLSLGLLFQGLRERLQTERLLEESRIQADQLQNQSEELKNQQEELRQVNQELADQAQALLKSQHKLSAQQDELFQVNQELESKNYLLQQRADDLARSSQYKSNFLANMSHELRTPLNCISILSKLLSENREGRLNEKDISCAKNINAASHDLRALIEDILDFSKIEAGKLNVDIQEVPLAEIWSSLERTFSAVAKDKGIEFRIELGSGLPEVLRTDQMRLEQVLKNLCSNAVKFTEHGGVTVEASYRSAQESLIVTVRDTGIGIPQDQLDSIFESFRQVDGSGTRRHGGTGLGLTISRQLARLLGGEILVTSSPGTGSCFTVSIANGGAPEEELLVPPAPGEEHAAPLRWAGGETSSEASTTPTAGAHRAASPSSARTGPGMTDLADDRGNLAPGDQKILIVEDELYFAELIAESARGQGFKVIWAGRIDVALELAKRYQPHAITLDIRLPGGTGWELMEAIRHDPTLARIPVHLISAYADRDLIVKYGITTSMEKPVTLQSLLDLFARIRGKDPNLGTRRVLLVQGDEALARDAHQALGLDEVHTQVVATLDTARSVIESQPMDLMILAMDLSVTGTLADLLGLLQEERVKTLPKILYTSHVPTESEESRLRQGVDSIIMQGRASIDRLREEVGTFLTSVRVRLIKSRTWSQRIRSQGVDLSERSILIVDDDPRNIFSLQTLLEAENARILTACNGAEALQMLDLRPDVDLVLMDMMMPELDGYEAMKRIRAQDRFRDLPVIALTAKAMPWDREQCLQAGASDYLPKPIDTDKLVSLIRVWLNQSQSSRLRG